MEPANLNVSDPEDVPTVPFPFTPPSQSGSSASESSDRDSNFLSLADNTSIYEDVDQSEDDFCVDEIHRGQSESLIDNPPKYSDFSDIFTKEEYLRIIQTYELMGLDGWLDLTTYPIFRSRGTKVLALCQRLEEFHIKQRVRLEKEKENEGATAQRLPQNNYSLTKLNENARERKRQRTKSPTSSSSNYGSVPSVRSRASWPSDIDEFPYAYPSGIPDQRKPFLDSDDYLRRKNPIPTTNEPLGPSTCTDDAPVEVAANSVPPPSRDPSPSPPVPTLVPPVPATSSTTAPLPDSPEPSPVHPPLKERIQRLFRRLPGRKRQRI